MTTLSTRTGSPSPFRDSVEEADAAGNAVGCRHPGDGSPAGSSPFKVSPWWPQAPAPRFKPYVLEVLAALVAVALLVAFSQVVHHSVLRGEQLRQAVAARSAATQHCNSLGAIGSGATCLRLLNAPAVAGDAQGTTLAVFAGR